MATHPTVSTVCEIGFNQGSSCLKIVSNLVTDRDCLFLLSGFSAAAFLLASSDVQLTSFELVDYANKGQSEAAQKAVNHSATILRQLFPGRLNIVRPVFCAVFLVR